MSDFGFRLSQMQGHCFSLTRVRTVELSHPTGDLRALQRREAMFIASR